MDLRDLLNKLTESSLPTVATSAEVYADWGGQYDKYYLELDDLGTRDAAYQWLDTETDRNIIFQAAHLDPVHSMADAVKQLCDVVFKNSDPESYIIFDGPEGRTVVRARDAKKIFTPQDKEFLKQLAIDPMESKGVNCEECGGTGRVECSRCDPDSNKRCGKCERGYERCPECNGSGKKKAVNEAGMRKDGESGEDYQARIAKQTGREPWSINIPDEGFKVGDKVHLGFGAKGGAGFDGEVEKIEGNTVWVRNPQNKVFKGPIKNLSPQEVLDENGIEKFHSFNPKPGSKKCRTCGMAKSHKFHKDRDMIDLDKNGERKKKYRPSGWPDEWFQYRESVESPDRCSHCDGTGKVLNEVAPADQESWVKHRKAEFINRYGKKKGLEYLYRTAWKRHNKS